MIKPLKLQIHLEKGLLYRDSFVEQILSKSVSVQSLSRVRVFATP